MIADAIVAIPGNAPLPTLLAAIHRERLGHVARVVSVTRAPLADQLQRAGVPMQQSPSLAGIDRVLLIFAANMCDRGSRLLLNLGADRAWTVTRTGTWTEVDAKVAQTARPTTPSHHHVLSQPHIDIGVQQ
ncbi:MAG: hypothetical protein WKF81_12050 [Thermomicrobiales bacterium]